MTSLLHSPLPSRIPIKTRLVGLSLGIVILTIALASLSFYRQATRELEERLVRELLAIVRSTALAINGDLLALIHRAPGGGITGQEEFDEIRTILERAAAANGLTGRRPSESPIYIMRPTGTFSTTGELEFIVMPQPDQNGTYYVGSRYRVQPHQRAALAGTAGGSPVYRDDEGSWISAAVPIRDHAGQVTAILQADRPVTVIEDLARQYAKSLALAALICLAVAAALAVWLARLFVKPIEDMVEATAQVSMGNLDHRVEAKWNDELGDLGVSINVMAERLVDQRRALEEAAVAAEAGNRAKAQFLAIISHELRTPLNGILGFNALLLESQLNEEQHHFSHVVQSSAANLLEIINDLLDFSKIDAGKLDIESIEFEPAPIVESVAEVISLTASKNVEVLAWVGAEIPDTMRGDPKHFRQVLMNLAGNAAKFTQSGSVAIRCSMKTVEDREMLRVAVTDTGPGIPLAVQERLFQPFTQADASTARHHGGTGLGLAISRRLVELMGGSIGLISAPGAGSTFWFTLPLPQVTPKRDDTGRFAGRRVLVANRSRPVLDILRGYIEATGAEAIAVLSGAEAIAASDSSIDAIVTGDHFSDMTGLELASRLKGQAPPMILVTSIGNRHSAGVLASAGVATSILKPVVRSTLIRALDTVFGAGATAAGLAPLLAATALPTLPPTGAEHVQPLRVLVAEDNAVNRELVLRLLRKSRVEATAATNGLEAAEAVARESFDLVLMDCQMPEMDGFEATRLIREREGQTRHTRILALTANTLASDREKCMDAGMDGFMTKPFNSARLAGILDALRANQPLDVDFDLEKKRPTGRPRLAT